MKERRLNRRNPRDTNGPLSDLNSKQPLPLKYPLRTPIGNRDFKTPNGPIGCP